MNIALQTLGPDDIIYGGTIDRAGRDLSLLSVTFSGQGEEGDLGKVLPVGRRRKMRWHQVST